MKRIQVNLLDDLEEKVDLFRKAEGIKTMAQACLRLVALGIDNYCDSYINELKHSIRELSKKLDILENQLKGLIVIINEQFDKLKQNE